ncbi:unnamed protein product [Anisakis simplex]|uniref:Col_cuticle_N domain-containing protein n=1 Tax=Anisakis simplex TaxID=6269 RepID=A0A0M3JTT0_ANISI|nr:unnamed protein product [Anisakis simplex]
MNYLQNQKPYEVLSLSPIREHVYGIYESSKRISNMQMLAIFGISLSALTIVSTFISVPMLIIKLNDMQIKAASDMNIFKKRSDQLWGDIQQIQNHLRTKRHKMNAMNSDGTVQLPKGFIPTVFRRLKMQGNKIFETNEHEMKSLRGSDPQDTTLSDELKGNLWLPRSRRMFAKRISVGDRSLTREQVLSDDRRITKKKKKKMSGTTGNYGSSEYPTSSYAGTYSIPSLSEYINVDSGSDRCQGPPGTPGEAGLNGINGEPGQDGMIGIDGDLLYLYEEECFVCPQGEQGFTGAVGERGLRGEKGEQGYAGIDGIPGKNSDQQGPPGDVGLQGENGLPGTQGPMGDMIISGIGSPGSPGPPGEPGLRGLPGLRGFDGVSVLGPDGPRGPTGTRGRRGETGVMGPTGDAGYPGDDAGYCPCPERITSSVERDVFGRDDVQQFMDNDLPPMSVQQSRPRVFASKTIQRTQHSRSSPGVRPFDFVECD